MSGFLNSDEESNVVRNLLEEFQMVETQMVETQMVENQKMVENQMEDADATHAREFAAFIEEEVRGNNEEDEDDEDDDDYEDQEKKEKVCEVDCSVCTAKPLFAVPEGFSLSECPICYENMEMINVTIARCGHTFHASCLFKALELKIDCPMCRTQLINILDDDDDEDDDDDDDNDDDDEDDYDEDDDIEDEYNVERSEESTRIKVTHEQLATKLTHIGYTPADFLRIAGCRVKSENDGKYVCAFYKKFHEDVDKIIVGEIKLADRDTRTYAQVVGNR